MGYTHWSKDAYAHLKSTYATKSRGDIFHATASGRIAPELDPGALAFRESRDSTAHPNSLAMAVFLDVTGSMGRIPEQLIRHKLGALMDTLETHGVADAQVMFSAIGDHYSDRAPLQVGQFESGTDELNAGLASVYLEGGGGGTAQESYLLAWLVAGRHTSIDCFEKRAQKGFLFTIGDEASWSKVEATKLKALLGYGQADDLTDRELLAQAQRMYHVFHIHANETHYRNHAGVLNYWRDLLGQHLLILDDHNAVAELIAATVATTLGADLATVTDSFAAGVGSTVRKALAKVSTSLSSRRTGGIVRL
jgi:hypothetical protein